MLTVEADLRRALERDELLVHYQPVVELESGSTVAVEALLRWQHPKGGLVLPASFVDVAEQRGLIGEIGAWVLHTACTQAAAWHQRFGDQAPVLAVNVSSRQLGDHCLDRQANCMSRQVRAALDAVRPPPTCGGSRSTN
jgi:EAL domain-containing protein (putative c-di-GMP-specific phosphodiesterase class I)